MMYPPEHTDLFLICLGGERVKENPGTVELLKNVFLFYFLGMRKHLLLFRRAEQLENEGTWS